MERSIIDRRDLLVGGLAGFALAGLSRRAFAATPGSYRNEIKGYGPLVPDPASLLDLPEGFGYRVISRSGSKMSDGLVVPGAMDGMACFDVGNGKVALVRNHELKAGAESKGAFAGGGKADAGRIYDVGKSGQPLPGGTTTLVYDTVSGRVVSEHLSLAGTVVNCAGGATPWGSWLSCEEIFADVGKPHGYVFEVPARAKTLVEPIPLKALGRFRHEAAAVDPRTGIVYLTEDRDDGLFYRMLPSRKGKLAAGGRLQALAFTDGDRGRDARNWRKDLPFASGAWRKTRWIDIEGADSAADDLRARGHQAGAVRFARGEGIHWGKGELYFTSTSGGAKKIGQIFRYVPSPREGQPSEADNPGMLQNFLESHDPLLLDFGDNITVSPQGHLIVCEDKSEDVHINHLKMITPRGKVFTLARNADSGSAEFAGVCYTPDGKMMFVNIYEPGYTIAITGQWDRFDESPIA